MIFVKFLALAVLAANLFGCSPKPAAGPTTSSSPAELTTVSMAQDEDKFATALLGDAAHHQPALEWLSDSRDHIIWGKGDRDSLRSHFTELQKAGVKEIWACTQDLKGKQIAYCYIVHLPSSGAQRVAAFEIHNRFWMSQTDDNAKLEVLRRSDVGQKYLLYNFD